MALCVWLGRSSTNAAAFFCPHVLRSCCARNRMGAHSKLSVCGFARDTSLHTTVDVTLFVISADSDTKYSTRENIRFTAVLSSKLAVQHRRAGKFSEDAADYESDGASRCAVAATAARGLDVPAIARRRTETRRSIAARPEMRPISGARSRWPPIFVTLCFHCRRTAQQVGVLPLIRNQPAVRRPASTSCCEAAPARQSVAIAISPVNVTGFRVIQPIWSGCQAVSATA